jgi:hypothetical protein
MSSFKILSTWCIKLIQKTPGAKRLLLLSFSFLALKAEAVGEMQILRQRRVTDGFFNRLNNVIYS